MNRPLISNSLFALASWLLLFFAVVSVGYAGLEVYARHVRPDAEQTFNFGSAEPSVSQGQIGLESVIASHVFGTVPVKAKPKIEKPKVVEAPETRLNLRLTGVVTAPDPSRSHAMIEVERGQTSVVRVGSEIGDTGARLDAVHPEHILIEHRGKIEKLLIERQKLSLNGLAGASAGSATSENFNVAEFEALAAVDPKDLDISNLLPQPEPADSEDPAQPVGTTVQNAAQANQPQAQPERVDSQGRPIKKNIPGGLKQID